MAGQEGDAAAFSAGTKRGRGAPEARPVVNVGGAALSMAEMDGGELPKP